MTLAPGLSSNSFEVTRLWKNTNPKVQANSAFISAVYKAAFGRNATQKEIDYYIKKGTKVKDVANLVLKQDSPWSESGEGTKAWNQANPNNTIRSTATKQAASSKTPTKYTGNGGKLGELPKRDASGKYQWVGPDGKLVSQPGYDASTGSWDYLGTHPAEQWTAAEGMYNSAQPPPVPFEIMTEKQKQEYIDKAHGEMAKNFQQQIAQGQTETLAALGSALEMYKRQMQSENLQLDKDVADVTNALEGAGLSFSGRSREELGDAFGAAGFANEQQLQVVNQNLANIKKEREAEIAAGTAAGVISTGDMTPAQVAARAESGTGQGVPGTGQYGIGAQDLNATAGTGLFEGRVFTRNRLFQESSRSRFNQDIRSIGRAAESLLGSSNLSGLNMPTFGGRSIFNPVGNVLGSLQSGYQTNVASRAGELAGNAIEQYGYTFPQ